MSPRDVVITGIGLISTLGEGTDAHWNALSAGAVPSTADSERFKPFTIHPAPAIEWGNQIPKRGDQRQMETWQRLGTYAAGLALDDAGFQDREASGADMDMVIAAGGGERDAAVDNTILDAARNRNDHGVLLNEKLTTELRPTLFLAQLSNLLAGNISIVHKVTGSSRTFMGEEGAGISAVDTAAARIRSGQSTRVLVGGAYNAEHPDMLMGYELGGFLHRGAFKPLWQREGAEGGGVTVGSGAAFLVLESRASAEERDRTPYAMLGPVASGRARRTRGELPSALADLASRTASPAQDLLVISGASGAHEATRAEKDFLDKFPGNAVRGFSGLTGHLKEAQFPFAIGLAALAVSRAAAFPPLDAENESELTGTPSAALATTVGYARGEGMVLVTEVD
ncbi:MAG: beta-ketoacyl-ACP synthase [Methylobacterium mesophilicum]|nr:beta-ketoacyl-ACP synthase [Methylobacterium mesophilicum]